ncbi:hypothetical protein DFJ77DRAFT_13545 [Powellomyces hirtus]|nr:hypothetical protein DFJ77DRAFT_13545 [Powellomyces hirtus]
MTVIMKSPGLTLLFPPKLQTQPALHFLPSSLSSSSPSARRKTKQGKTLTTRAIARLNLPNLKRKKQPSGALARLAGWLVQLGLLAGGIEIKKYHPFALNFLPVAHAPFPRETRNAAQDRNQPEEREGKTHQPIDSSRTIYFARGSVGLQILVSLRLGGCSDNKPQALSVGLSLFFCSHTLPNVQNNIQTRQIVQEEHLISTVLNLQFPALPTLLPSLSFSSMSYLKDNSSGSNSAAGGLLGDILGAFDELLVQENSAPATSSARTTEAPTHGAPTSTRRQNPFLAPPPKPQQPIVYTARVHKVGKNVAPTSAPLPSTAPPRSTSWDTDDHTVARSTVVKSLLGRAQPPPPQQYQRPQEQQYHPDLDKPADDYWNKWKGLAGVEAPRNSLSIANQFRSRSEDRYSSSSSRARSPAAPKAFNRASRMQQHHPAPVASGKPNHRHRRPQYASSSSSAGSSISEGDSDSDTPVGAVAATAGAIHGRAARRIAMQKAAAQQKKQNAAAIDPNAPPTPKSPYILSNGSSSSAGISNSSANSSSAGIPPAVNGMRHPELYHQPAAPTPQQLQHRMWQPPTHLQPLPVPAPLASLRTSETKQPLIKGYREYVAPEPTPPASSASSSTSSSPSGQQPQPAQPQTDQQPQQQQTPDELAYMQYQQQQYAAAYTAYMMQQQQLYAGMYGTVAPDDKAGKKASKKKDTGLKKKKKKKAEGTPAADDVAAVALAAEASEQQLGDSEEPSAANNLAPSAVAIAANSGNLPAQNQ